MKKANITVKVTYDVSMICDVPDDVYEALEHACDNYNEFDYSDADQDRLVSKAFDWVVDQCKEADATSWLCEIEEVYCESEI